MSFLESKRYERLAKDLNVTIEDIAEAAHLIASLEPKPSRGFEQDEECTVLPDVFVEKIGGGWVIDLNDDGVPRLRVSSLYRRMAGQEDATANKYVHTPQGLFERKNNFQSRGCLRSKLGPDRLGTILC